MGVMNLEIHMRKYHGETRDGSYAVTLLHAANDARPREEEARVCVKPREK